MPLTLHHAYRVSTTMFVTFGRNNDTAFEPVKPPTRLASERVFLPLDFPMARSAHPDNIERLRVISMMGMWLDWARTHLALCGPHQLTATYCVLYEFVGSLRSGVLSEPPHDSRSLYCRRFALRSTVIIGMRGTPVAVVIGVSLTPCFGIFGVVRAQARWPDTLPTTNEFT